MLLGAGAVFAGDDVCSGRPDGVYVALVDVELLDEIVVAEDDFSPGFTFLNREHGGERLVVDADGCDGGWEPVFVRMGEQDDGLFGMIDDGVGEAGLVGKDELDVVVAWNVGGGDEDEFRPVDGGVVVDGEDASAWDGTADGCAVPEAGPGEVVDVLGTASDLGEALFAELRGADDAGCGGAGHGVFGEAPVRTGAGSRLGVSIHGRK